MQLNAVVLPAPLGPIRPTISYSSARNETASSAWRPPNRMPRSLTSRTANCGTCLSSRVVFPGVQRELPAADPVLDRGDLLADAAGVADQREHQQCRADDGCERRVDPVAELDAHPAQRLDDQV